MRRVIGVDALRSLLCCPLCRSDLEWAPQVARCLACGTEYVIQDGIPILVAHGREIEHDELDHDHGGHRRRQATWFDEELRSSFEIARPHGTPALYDRLLRDKARRALAPLGERLDGRTALVVAGGSGMDAEFIAERGASVITSDISLGAARRAVERSSRYGLQYLSVVAAAEQLPLRDRAVDLVYVHDGLHHLADPRPAIDEMSRVSGRWVAISEPARAMATQIATRLGLALEREPAGNRVLRLNPVEIVGWLRHTGFRALQSKRYAMYYRHEPGRMSTLLSQPWMLPLAIRAWRALDLLLGRIGNKLVVVAERVTAAAQHSTRVAFVSQAPAPYLTPILNALAERVDLHVVFFGRPAHRRPGRASWTDFQDPWGEPARFSHEFHPAIPFHETRTDLYFQMSLGVSRRLASIRPDVLVVQSWGPPLVEPMLWARLHRLPTVMWIESHASSGLARGRLADTIRQPFLSLADAFVSNGSLATSYAVSLGVDARRIITSCLPAPRIRGETRAGNDRIPGPRFLFVGRLIPLKRPVELVRAFARVADRLPGSQLTIVGDGPAETAVRRAATPLDGRIRVVGRLEREALHAEMLASDVLVVPSSRDVWGLVVNEGLAAGLFVVATRGVGSAADLIDADSGLIIDTSLRSLDAALVEAAERIATDPNRREYRATGIVGCSADRFADDLGKAIRVAQLRQRPRATAG